MRTLRIIYPQFSYEETLQFVPSRLEHRRNELHISIMDILTKGQSVIKHHLSIYLFTIHNILQSLKTRIKNNSRLNKHILLKLSSQNTRDF